jgi:antitoxin (DNA-binding transcriptional repressor) of toxin-antitoxin stability system
MTRLSATEVARNLAAVLNRVALGEDFEVVRQGRPRTPPPLRDP